jgi:lipopolysaccharide biosynthesis glycosyltransferase
VNVVRRRLKPARTPAKQTRSAPPWAARFKRVGRILLGPDGLPEHPRWDGALAQAVISEAARSHALATFARMISRGATLEEAQVATTRALLSVSQEHYRQRYTARGLAEGMISPRARHLGHGLVLHEKALPALAWARLSQVDEDTLTRLVPVEAVDCALVVGTPEAVSAAVRIAERASELDIRDVIALSGRFLVTGHSELARMLVEEADRRHADDLDTVARGHDYSARDELENVRRWTHPIPLDQAGALDGAVNLAVIDYHQPDLKRTSRNVGDYVQTLAMLSNLARFQEARFTGGDGLGDLVTSLQGRVDPELRIDGVDANVHLMPVSRDFSEGEDIPENTWMVAFGWHMHSLFELRFGLPYHPNLNPVFVSFHLNTIEALTPETIEYLKAHGPIGCRDWTTVDLLLSAGIDAFFTGCLSTTVNAIFPKIDDVEREQPGAVAVIDAPVAGVKANRPIEKLTHRDPRYREAGLVEGTRLAVELLENYQRRYHRIVTSRLHSYLPAVSLGVPVTFKPRRIGDVRFDGLLGMTPDAPEVTAMRDGIRQLLAATFERIFAGAGRDQVYAYWREITAPQVAEARKRHEAPLPPDESVPAIDIPALVKTVREAARAFGPHDTVDPATVSDLALAVDQNLKQHLPTTLESLIGNATGSLRLWILSRGIGEGYQQWISDAWPDVPITFLNLDGCEYGDIGRMIRHVTISTMDRLALPELLSDLDRVIYIDIDTVTEGDVCELATMDLGGYPLAARTSVHSATEQWRQAGRLLSAEKASELRRTMSARHAFDYKGFNAGVLVLDLARMRMDDFAATHLPLVPRFGLNDQDVLVAYVGPDRAELDEKWNVFPIREEITAPSIIHFAGMLKPWNEELTLYGERWQLYAERVRARVGEPPA